MKEPDPPAYFDELHPLARDYNLSGRLWLDEVWFRPRERGLALHLMRMRPDLDLPADSKEGE